jgi:hypothetical protein
MNLKKKLSGAAIATAAAGLFMAGAVTTTATAGESAEAKVHCFGVNGCKGQTACATATNACNGLNSCKGKGWLPMTAQECSDKGGEVKAE